MDDETEIGSAGASDRRRYSGSGSELSSPLQARAQFFKNWSWESIIGINRRACEGGGAQHGLHSEAAGACATRWESCRSQTLTLAEALELLRQFHRNAPFLFFNGNTFAFIARELSFAIFSDAPASSKRGMGSAIAHYVSGVLDREPMVEIVEGLWAQAPVQPGDSVKSLRGSATGVVIQILSDGRIVWRPDGSRSELIASPDTLLPQKKPRERN
jgi:hypothetical protein